MSNLVNQFIENVAAKDHFQCKALRKIVSLDEEKNNFECFLQFCIQKEGKTIDELTDAYLFLINMFREETYYFVRNGKYRFNKYDEVANSVYGNPEYMEKYMIGVHISDYIMFPHLKMMRFFDENLTNLSKNGGGYLEIGPGSGQFFIKALRNGCFSEYNACDLSPTSVKLCNDYLKFLGMTNNYKIECKNFFNYDKDKKYNCIVMGEVLEHVEDPALMLKQLYELLNVGGKAFITTVINGPCIDHIYLFHNKEEVLELMHKVGFTVVNYILAIEGDVSLEKAEKKKYTIDIAMILSK